jgi:zinc protease
MACRRIAARGAGMRVFFLLLLVMASTALFQTPSRAAEEDVTRATLPNGLKVVVVRNRLAPVVATSVNYLVGSNDSPAGFPGTAHAQEHMMFRGSAGLTADQLADIGNIMGGDFNANTTEDITQYLFTVPAADLDVALHIEALRMADITDSQEGWNTERGAIEQEVAADVSGSQYKMETKLRTALFGGTPYEHDALGSQATFDATNADMLKKFHDAWYAPNNAVLVVVGDVDPQATLATIKNLFGGIKSKTLPAHAAINLGPVDLSPIQITSERPVASKLLAMRFPGSESADFPALELLSDVLSSRRFALYALVAQGKALSTRFSISPLPKASMASASISVAPKDNLDEAEKSLRAILTDVAEHGVPADLVTAAKTREYREMEVEKNSIEGLSSEWADAVARNGLSSPEEEWARLEKVTPEDVNRVARQYLDLSQAVTVTSTPKAGNHHVQTEQAADTAHETIDLGDAKPTPLPDWAEVALNRLTVPTSTLHPVVSTLPNGITLIVQPETVSDTVSVFGHIQNRPETEMPSGKDGVSQVLSAMFKYGSETLDRMSFQEELDQIGASERAGTDFQLQTLSQDFDRGVSLLADNELHPALSKDAMETARDQYREMVADRMQTPGFLASQSLRESLFTKDDPSLRQPVPENIGRLTMDDVKDYFKTAFRPDLTTIVVIGKVTPDEARAVIGKYFGDWKSTGPKPNMDLPKVSANKSATLTVPDDSRIQDTVALAENVPLARQDQDYYALTLGNAVLAGGFYSSRLSTDLRKRTGLVYSVDADLDAGRTRSVFMVSYACDPSNVNKAADIVSHDLKDLQSTPIPDEELTRAKAYLLRQIPLEEANVSGIARSFSALRDLDLPLDEPTIAASRYVSLNASDVQAAFRKWVRPGDLVRVSQGPTPH